MDLDHCLALLGRGEQDVGIVGSHKVAALRRRLTDDDTPWPVQHHAEQGAESRRPSPDDEDGIFLRDLADACRPEACSQHVADQQCLLVGHTIGNAVQSLRSQRHAHILRLSTVDAASQSPAAMGRGTVVDIAMLAEEAFATEGLHVDRHAVADLHAPDIGSHLLHHTDHLVAHGDARHRPWHTSVLDMKVTGANASQGHAHDGVGELSAMHRRHTKAEAYALVEKLRGAIPDLALRTTLLVGYPGETEASFR